MFERFNSWNAWRKVIDDTWRYKLSVLFGLTKSPTYEAYYRRHFK